MHATLLRQALASIRRDLDHGALDGALAGLKNVMRAAPLHSEAHFLLGAYFWRRGQWDRARSAMKWAVLCDPALPEAWENLVLLGSVSDHLKGHVADYGRARMAGVAPARLAEKIHDPAHSALLKAWLCVDPADAELTGILALAVLDQDEEAPARRWVARAMVSSTVAGAGDLVDRICVAWGRWLQARGRFSGALAPLRRAVLLQPGESERYFDLGRSDMDAGRDQAAGRMVARSLLVQPQEAGFVHQEIRRLVAAHPTEVPTRSGYHCVETAAGFPVKILPVGQPAPRIEYKVPATFLARADDALLLAGHHSVILPQGEVLMEGLTYRQKRRRWDGPCYAYVADDGAVLAMLPPPEPAIESDAVLLGGGGNYYHNVVDWLSRMPAIIGDPQLAELPLLVSNDVPASVIEILEMLGVSPDRLRLLTPGLHPVKRLWVPSLAHGRLGCVSPRYLDFLEERLFSRFRAGPTQGPRRLYFGRRDDRHRRIVNAEPVMALLEKFGFETVALERMSAREQFELCAGAEAVVAPFGAGLTNMLACPETTAVIELTHEHAVRPLFPILAGLRGQPFYRIVGSAERSRVPVLPLHADFSVPVAQLESVLREVVA
jgi:capsular polysaccharide biosynthesis protein/Flp pilus assembly protein TadD